MSAPSSTFTNGNADGSVEAKRELLKSLLRKGGGAGTRGDASASARPSGRAGTPLTPEQRGLLFLHRLDPEAGLYDIPVAVELRGPLDTRRLAAAFDALTDRHPILATRVAGDPRGPVLAPAPDVPRLEVRQGTAAGAPPSAPAQVVAAEAARPLDPERAVLRAVLFSHAPDHHHLLLLVHHLVFDGHSSVVVLQDLWALYREAGGEAGAPAEDEAGARTPSAATGEAPAGLQPAGAPFEVYAAARAADAAAAEQRLTDFWRERVTGVTGAPLLPFDRPGTTVRTREPGHVPVRFGPARTAALQAFAAQSRTSVFAVLLSAYLLVLGRHDPRRLAVGTPAAMRHDPRFDRTVGYLTNMLPVRSPLPAGDTGTAVAAGDYVRGVRAELAACLDHAALPFPRIAELLDDGPDPEDGSPFTCPFAFQHWHGDSDGDVSPGLRARIDEGIQQPGVGHVNLTLVERDGDIRGQLKYDRERFDKSSAVRISEEIAAVAAALAARPGDPVSEVLGSALRSDAGPGTPRAERAEPEPPETHEAVETHEAPGVSGTGGSHPESGEVPSAGRESGGACRAEQADEAVGTAGRAATADEDVLSACLAGWAALLPEPEPEGDAATLPEQTDFFAAGGDSIVVVQLVTRLRKAGHRLSARDVFRNPTPRALALLLTERRAEDTGAEGGPAPTAAAPAPSLPAAEAAPALSPVQSWFFERITEGRGHWNLSVAVRLRRPVDPLLLRLALQSVADAHPALTCRVQESGDGHEVRPGPAPTGRDAREMLTVADGGEAEAEQQWQAVQRGLDPAAGRALRALLVRDGDSGGELRLTAHHLVMDAVSWGIVLADLDTALAALAEGELPRLPPEATGERAWAALLARAARDPRGAAYWRSVVQVRHECDGLLASALPGPESAARHEEFALGERETRLLLTDVPRRSGLPVHTVLTGSVALALARWRGCRLVTLDVETHGRPDSASEPGPEPLAPTDLSRTVGWLTSVEPVVLSGPREAGPETYLREIAPALAARTAHAGCPTYRWLSPDPAVRAELAAVPPALVSFNYLGQTDRLVDSGLLAPAPPPGGDRSPDAPRLHPAELYAVVRDGRLRFGVVWSPSPSDGLDGDSVRALCSQVHGVLAELAAPHGESAPVSGPENGMAIAPAVTDWTRAEAEPGAAAPGTVEWPLTPQQLGVVAEALAASVPGQHVEQFHWWWGGAFDAERFDRAWQVLLRRHLVLRARLVDGATPRLSAAPDCTPPLARLPGASADGPAWEEVVRAERDRGFAPGEPLLRLTVRPEDGRHRLLMTFHHALLDGWSVALLLEQLYEAYLDGTGPEETAPHRPDARDHATWVAGRDEEQARAYFEGRLNGADAAALPGLSRPAGPLPAASGTEPAQARSELPAATVDALRVWAARHAATESNVLQAVWAALLWRCAGGGQARRSRLGVTMSGRADGPEGVRGIPGMLATTLPLDLAVDPGDRVADLLVRAREAALDLQDVEWVSAGQVHGWARLPGREPLFDSLLVVENYPASLGGVGERLAAAGCDVGVPTAAGARTGYAVTAVAHRRPGAFVTEFVADGSRVDAADAERLARLWGRCLSRLADAPEELTVLDLVGGVGDDELPRVAPRRAAEVPAADGTAAWPASGQDADVVRAAFREVLGVEDVAAGDNFYALGGHSLLSVRLLKALADRGAPSLTLGDLVRHPVAGALAALVAERRTGTPPDGQDPAAAPLVPLRDPEPGDGGPPVTVYLVHPPGGQVACYGGLAAQFPGPARLVGVQDPRTALPGDVPARTVEELARSYAQALPEPAEGERIVLGGFSGGGVIAYELARVLHAEGRAPDLVVMLDAAAPTGRTTDTEADGSFLRQVEAYDRSRGSAAEEPATRSGTESGTGSGMGPGDDVAGLAPDEYLDELAQVAAWMGGGGPDPFALLRETLGAVESYRPGPYPGPLLVLRAAETDFGRGSAFDASDAYYARRCMGWEDHCSLVTVEEVPGNHISLLSHDHAAELAGLLAARIARTEDPA
ncbi:Thioesterase domain-containing protein [Streptomyces sp. WMMB 714]|uniref:condensation domain-containing protein n=1 Tax=Streptomyces sp. WMMB 714 TaxID=1286822 RepID=UPI0005F78A24|nr:condensation domain-containing protein [Streptomyces sp. WMMB 714]SCK31522.1 Thioesterase domain-containing protein [Streptomyces sp. WMMB 714]